ncbi:hypothetical protein LCGC14_2244650, partial [marine sediment metagenome]
MPREHPSRLAPHLTRRGAFFYWRWQHSTRTRRRQVFHRPTQRVQRAAYGDVDLDLWSRLGWGFDLLVEARAGCVAFLGVVQSIGVRQV